MPEGRKRRTHYFSVKPERFSVGICPFILLERTQKKSFKCKAKRDITCGICGEDSATAASFLRPFPIAPITVIPPCLILTHLSPTLHCKLFLIAPITVIPPCHILTYHQRYIANCF